MFLDVLRVVGGEAREHEHADEEMIHCIIDDASQMFTSDAMMTPIRPMNRNGRHAREVALRGVALEAERTERRRGDEEHAGDRSVRVDHQDDGERNADHRCVNPEGKLRCADAHLLDAEAQEKYQRERRENDDPLQRADEQRVAELR